MSNNKIFVETIAVCVVILLSGFLIFNQPQKVTQKTFEKYVSPALNLSVIYPKNKLPIVDEDDKHKIIFFRSNDNPSTYSDYWQIRLSYLGEQQINNITTYVDLIIKRIEESAKGTTINPAGIKRETVYLSGMKVEILHGVRHTDAGTPSTDAYLLYKNKMYEFSLSYEDADKLLILKKIISSVTFNF